MLQLYTSPTVTYQDTFGENHGVTAEKMLPVFRVVTINQTPTTQYHIVSAHIHVVPKCLKHP